MFERSGGLRLCACEHTRAHHEPRPAWHGAPPDQLEHGCFFCECAEYREGEFQGLGPGLKGPEYVARRAALGLPRMRLGTVPPSEE